MKKVISIILIMILVLSTISVSQADTPPSTKSTFKQLVQVSTSSNQSTYNARMIQEICYAWSYQARTKLGSIDGVFGPNSKKALKEFQTDVSLYPVDGVCGPNTYGKIYDKLRVYTWGSSSGCLSINYRPGYDCDYTTWHTFDNLEYRNDSGGMRYRFSLYGTWRELS